MSNNHEEEANTPPPSENEKQESLPLFSNWELWRAQGRELREENQQPIHDVMWTLPEINSAFAIYEVLLPAFLEFIKQSNIPQFQAMDKAWTGADGAAVAIIGLLQLFDEQTHRGRVTKAKGLLNIGSGTLALVCVAIASPILPFAFAAVACNDLLLSLDPLQHEISRALFFEFWLEDSFNQLDKLRALRDELQSEIDTYTMRMGASPDKKFADQITWIIKKKTERLDNLNNKYNHLSEDINTRLGYQKQKLNQGMHSELNDKIRSNVSDYNNAHHTNFLKALEPDTDEVHLYIMPAQEAIDAGYTNCYVWCNQKLSYIAPNKITQDMPITENGVAQLSQYDAGPNHTLQRSKILSLLDYSEKEAIIQEEMKKECGHCLFETFVFSLVVTGWTMYSIPNPSSAITIAALVFIAAGTLCYIYKNSDYIYQNRDYINHFLFNTPLPFLFNTPLPLDDDMLEVDDDGEGDPLTPP